MSTENGHLADASAAATADDTVGKITAAGLSRFISAGTPQASPFDETNYQTADPVANESRPGGLKTIDQFLSALMATFIEAHVKEADSDGSIPRFSLAYTTPVVVDTENNFTIPAVTHKTPDSMECLNRAITFFPVEVSGEVIVFIYEVLKLYFAVDKWPKFSRIAEFVEKITVNPAFAQAAEANKKIFPELKGKLEYAVVRSFAKVNDEYFSVAHGTPEYEKKIVSVSLFLNACAKICFELAMFTKPEYVAALNKETVAKVNVRVPKISLNAFVGYIVALDGALRDTVLDIIKKLENLEIVAETAKKAKPVKATAARKTGAGKKLPQPTSQ